MRIGYRQDFKTVKKFLLLSMQTLHLLQSPQTCIYSAIRLRTEPSNGKNPLTKHAQCKTVLPYQPIPH